MPAERAIGLILPRSYAYYRRILRGITRYAERRPWWQFVPVFPEIGRATRETLKNVDAAIVGISSREWCRFVLRTGTKFVNIDCMVPNLPVCRVGVDNSLIGQMAAEHFVERAIRSFAFVGHTQYLFSTEREAAFQSAVESHGHTLAVYHSDVEHSYELGGLCRLSPSLGRWLLSLPSRTGMLVPNDAWGLEATEWCRKVGLRVPEDIAVLGVDDDDLLCEIARPRLSSIIVPAEAIGMRAAALVDQLLSGREMKQDVLLPPSGVAVRRSTDILAIHDQDVVSAIRFIRQNCHRPLRVSDVLREVAVSRRSLERRVFDAIGITLGAEIRRARLEYAKHLLAESDLTLKEIAAQSGFSDAHHLAVTFRKTLQQTPTSYRRNAIRRERTTNSQLG